MVEIALSGKLRSLKIGQQKKSPFHYCVTESKFAFAELFLRFGSDVNQPRLDGKSVLIDAVGKFIFCNQSIDKISSSEVEAII